MRGVKHRVAEGATPEISVEQARKLLRSIDLGHVVGLRDRAVLGVLAYTGARVGAVARLRLGDLRNFGEQRALRFREKGGKVREIPVRHDLDAWLRAYLDAAGVAGQDDKMPLFRAADGKRRQLTPAAYRAHSMRQMLKRRLEDCGSAAPVFPAQLPGRGGDRSAQPERAARGCAVPRRTLQPQDHPDLRSPAPPRHAQYRRANFDLKRR